MKKIIVIMLISMLILTTTTTVFGVSNLTELNEEFPNINTIIEENKDICPYYVLVSMNGMKMALFTDKIMYCMFDELTLPNGIVTNLTLICNERYHYKGYILEDNTMKLSTDTYFNAYDTLVCHTDVAWDKYSIQYCNYDIKDINGTTFFGVARYPLTTIKGQISSRTITTLTLMEIKTLIVFLMGLIISVVAFRKAWGMLRTILLGA